MNDEDRYEEPDKMVTCPYNQAHTVQKFRMARHLIKCRRQFQETCQDLRTCPFNNTHQVPPIELQYHESTCPDREAFYAFKFKVDEGQNKVVNELMNNVRQKIEIESDENWDNEINMDQDIITSIRQKAEQNIIVSNNSNLPPAERRAKICEQRMKMRDKLNQEENKQRRVSTASASSARSAVSSVSDSSRTSYATAYSNPYRSRYNADPRIQARGRARFLPNRTNNEIGLGRGRML